MDVIPILTLDSQNQINIWKYPTMTQTANLTEHTFRVLYLAMSPDGQHIVTGAGDETLRVILNLILVLDHI